MVDWQETAMVETRRWLERAVIGLDLCPFARAVHARGQIRTVVSEAATPEALLHDLGAELAGLRDADPEQVDTVLLVHPRVLGDFLEYNDFLDLADALLEELDLAREIQVASFHPQYRFADAAPDAIENYTNRSPHPMLHLLRESSVARAVAAMPDSAVIYERNIATMRQLGHAGWERLGLTAATHPVESAPASQTGEANP